MIVLPSCSSSPLLEQGCGIGPATGDIVIPNWSLSRSAALDIKVIHPLNNSKISDAGQTSGASAAVSELEKLLWVVLKEVKCVPLVVEAYGDWELTASETFSRIARHLWSSTPTHPTLNSKCNALFPRHCSNAAKCPSPPVSIGILSVTLCYSVVYNYYN